MPRPDFRGAPREATEAELVGSEGGGDWIMSFKLPKGPDLIPVTRDDVGDVILDSNLDDTNKVVELLGKCLSEAGFRPVLRNEKSNRPLTIAVWDLSRSP